MAIIASIANKGLIPRANEIPPVKGVVVVFLSFELGGTSNQDFVIERARIKDALEICKKGETNLSKIVIEVAFLSFARRVGCTRNKTINRNQFIGSSEKATRDTSVVNSLRSLTNH